MEAQSFICTCGDAIRVEPDGRRTTLINGRPHLDHTAYVAWMERHGLTDASLGWLYEVINWPRGIRDQIASPRLLRACGLLPGIDWSSPGPTDGRRITTPGQQPHYSGFETPWVDPDPADAPELPLERQETGQTAPKEPDPTPSTPDPVHQQDVAARFGTGGDDARTPGRTAAGRWGR